MALSVKRQLTGDLYLPKGTPLRHRLRWNKLLRTIALAARDCGQVWHVTSGYRSYAEQKALYRRNMNPYTGRPRPGRPLTAKPGTSNHEGGNAADVSVLTRRGRTMVYVPIADSARRRNACRKRGLYFPVSGEPWHMELVKK